MVANFTFTLNHMYMLFVLERNTWNYTLVSKLFVLNNLKFWSWSENWKENETISDRNVTKRFRRGARARAHTHTHTQSIYISINLSMWHRQILPWTKELQNWRSKSISFRFLELEPPTPWSSVLYNSGAQVWILLHGRKKAVGPNGRAE